MAKPIPINMREVQEVLDVLLRRLVSMETLFVDEENDLTLREGRIAKSRDSLDHELMHMRAQITEFKKAIGYMNDAFTRLTEELRVAVKKEDIERLGSRIDRLDVGTLVTSRALARELDEAFPARAQPEDKTSVPQQSSQ
jgi:hypothetical protein